MQVKNIIYNYIKSTIELKQAFINFEEKTIFKLSKDEYHYYLMLCNWPSMVVDGDRYDKIKEFKIKMCYKYHEQN